MSILSRLLGQYRTGEANNRKETKGRGVRKQYAPLYLAKGKKREELEARWKEEGVPSYEIERRFRRKQLVLHEVA